MRVTIVTISRRQSAEVSSRMVSEKTHVATSAWYVLFFLAAPFYAFQTFPGKAQLFPPLFSLRFKCCDWHVWSLKVSGASEGMNSVYCFFLSVDNLILIILNGICVHKIDVLDSVYSAYDRPTLILENHIIFKVHFSSNFIRVKSSKLPSKKVKQFSNKFKHRPPLCPSFKWFCCLLDNFCTIGTVQSLVPLYKVFPWSEKPIWLPETNQRSSLKEQNKKWQRYFWKPNLYV